MDQYQICMQGRTYVSKKIWLIEGPGGRHKIVMANVLLKVVMYFSIMQLTPFNGNFFGVLKPERPPLPPL